MLKIVLTLLMCCLVAPQLQAKKLYKYQDKQGRWYYSDKPPKTKQKVEIRQLKAGTKRHVWLEKRGDKKTPEYFVINNYHGPIEVEVSLVKARNVDSNPQLPNRFVVPYGKSDTLFQMRGINQYQSWSYSLQYTYMIGSPLAHHNEQTRYVPPFARNEQFQISQAFGGKFSHSDPQNLYAVDIPMPINTAIHAARAGLVMEVNNDFIKGGAKQAYKSRANSIRILHDDGSMAIYAHLALEKAQVYPGLEVTEGQLIGYSGDTGFSTGPHLHFAIQLNKGMDLVSVPFKFTDSVGTVKIPQVGAWLTNR
ncbi:MAG: M23 family metallopeptidase [Methylococcales bacterium]|nr:M23 family metallopeptidase [Methylococcales bacterium]